MTTTTAATSTSTTAVPSTGITTSTSPGGVSGAPALASAQQAWVSAGGASAATAGGLLTQAASDLSAAVAAGDSGTDGFTTAAQELSQMASIPATNTTPTQQAESLQDTIALNAFFATNGLFGISAPSSTPAQFVATLQEEANSGYLSGGPGAISGATVSCPFLTSLAMSSAFGCKISSPGGTYLVVGEIQAAQATSYDAPVVSTNTAVACTNVLNSAEKAVLLQLGGTCSS